MWSSFRITIASLTALLLFVFTFPRGEVKATLAQQTQKGTGQLSTEQRERFGGTYRRPLGDLLGTLDPARTNDIYARTIAQQIYDGLV